MYGSFSKTRGPDTDPKMVGFLLQGLPGRGPKFVESSYMEPLGLDLPQQRSKAAPRRASLPTPQPQSQPYRQL